MRYFYDTEFIEDGSTISLISIGVVAEDGREYYAVSTDCDLSRACSWVQANVISQLPAKDSGLWKSSATIRKELEEFLLEDHRRPELWAWVGAYDHVLLAQLWGDMSALPERMPHYTRDLRQYWEFVGRPELPLIGQGKHNALEDARHNFLRFKRLMEIAPLDRRSKLVNLPN
ncbi:MAG: polyadenylate-specific 3'-exoribonuclease AS [Corynebacterium sp.]|nr:polyadenylate-specific 3'-exoribonuclease AS [Corynebacterium sp.]